MLESSLVSGFQKFDPTSFEEDGDALSVVFNLQRMLMSACEVEILTPDVAFWVTQQALIAEVSEAVENFADLTKPWKRSVSANIQHLKEEVIDELFFVMQSFILLGMTSEEVVEMYKAKNTENFRRIIAKRQSSEEMVG